MVSVIAAYCQIGTQIEVEDHPYAHGLFSSDLAAVICASLPARSASWKLADRWEVLQFEGGDLIGWLDAPAHDFGFGSFQGAAIRTGRHLIGGWLVPAFLSVLLRRARTPCRTRPFGRSRHRLEGGATLGPRASMPIAHGRVAPHFMRAPGVRLASIRMLRSSWIHPALNVDRWEAQKPIGQANRA